MRFIHLGDLHIGKSLGDFDLIDDQKYILNQIIDLAVERHVDSMIIAGDVYDKSIPSEAAVNLFDAFLQRLVEKNIKTYIISGNHDSDERLNFGSSLFANNNIYIAAKYVGEIQKEVQSDEYGNVNIYMMPFIKAAQVRHYYPDEDIANYDQAVRVAIEKTDIDYSERNIIVAHQFVAGKSSDPELSGSEGIGVQNVGLVEKIGVDCFDKFDYVALGHIHSPQKLMREEVRYSGSPLKYSLSEVNNDKSVPIVEINGKGEVNIELVPLKPLRDLRHIKGNMEQLLQKDNIIAPNDFIYATLTDEYVINDAMGIMQQYYPFTVKIDYDNKHTREVTDIEEADVRERKSFDFLFTDFYSSIYGCDISDEELKVMLEVAREAGVIDEAN